MRKRRLMAIALVLIGGLWLARLQAQEIKYWQGQGKIVASDPGSGTVTVDHKEIKGLMAAMTMRFRVEDKDLLQGIKTGDEVSFTLKETETALTVSKIKKVGQ